jgi:hypothetical protein
MPTKRPFKMPTYKTYNPAKEGFGNVDAWRDAWEVRMPPDKARHDLGDESPLKVLGLLSVPTVAELKAVYRRLVMINHPDRGGNAAEFIKIHAAYSLLMDQLE